MRQAHRFDPDGAYVRRYVAELAGRPGQPSTSPGSSGPRCSRLGYPAPIVDHADAVAEFRARRGLD